jgi:Zn ribbon nucleic-acid-binding protein
MGVGQDYKVSRQYQPDIASIAAIWRAADPAYIASNSFDVAELLVAHVLPTLAKQGRQFCLVIVEDDPGDPLGWVEFETGLVCFQTSTWKAATLGDPLGRLVVAHEIGHLLLHRHQSNAFSSGLSKKLNFVSPQESAEQQANWFAAALLIPDHLMFKLGYLDDETIATLTLTTTALVAVRRRECKGAKLSANAVCPQCQTVAVVQLGTNTLCVSCGDRSTESQAPLENTVDNPKREGFPQ